MKERPLVYPVTVCNQPCPLLLIFSQNRGKNAFVSEKGYKSQAKRSKSYPLLLTSVQNRPKSQDVRA